MVLLLATVTAVPASASTARATRAGTDAPRPNVVFVLTDDLDATGGPFWKALPKTRALVADRGTTFDNAFVTDPVCCPARGTILTGEYPHNSGVWSSYTESIGGAENRTMGARMQAAGYSTAFVGKYLNGYELAADRVPPGWDEWFGLADGFLKGFAYRANHNGTIESFGKKPRDYQTDVLARVSTAFVDRATADASPFLLFVSPSAPHSPIGPAPRDAGNPFADDRLPRRPNFDEADVSDKPTWLREGVHRLDVATRAKETDRYRDAMGSLYAVDDLVDRIARRLRAHGALDDTVFVFTSDNGMNRGAHRLTAKATPYEESIRVPLAIAGPGVPHGTDHRMVTHADLAPTVYELAGLPVPADVDGRSIAPFDGDTPWRTEFLVEYRQKLLQTLDDVREAVAADRLRFLVPTWRALRTRDWLYVQWYAGDEHEYELYDLARDPYQLDNLLATPEGVAQHRATTDELQARLDVLGDCAGAACG
jgi:arylsulfatase A-like enzyme